MSLHFVIIVYSSFDGLPEELEEGLPFGIELEDFPDYKDYHSAVMFLSREHMTESLMPLIVRDNTIEQFEMSYMLESNGVITIVTDSMDAIDAIFRIVDMGVVGDNFTVTVKHYNAGELVCDETFSEMGQSHIARSIIDTYNV